MTSQVFLSPSFSLFVSPNPLEMPKQPKHSAPCILVGCRHMATNSCILHFMQATTICLTTLHPPQVRTVQWSRETDIYLVVSMERTKILPIKLLPGIAVRLFDTVQGNFAEQRLIGTKFNQWCSIQYSCYVQFDVYKMDCIYPFFPPTLAMNNSAFWEVPCII